MSWSPGLQVPTCNTGEAEMPYPAGAFRLGRAQTLYVESGSEITAAWELHLAQGCRQYGNENKKSARPLCLPIHKGAEYFRKEPADSKTMSTTALEGDLSPLEPQTYV